MAASDAPQSDYSHPDVLTSSFSNTSTQLLNDTKCLVPENLIGLNFPARDPAAVASRVVELVTASATKTGRIMNTFCGGWWLDRIRAGGSASKSSHYRAGDTTSGAAEDPHLARDVTY